MMKTSPGHTPPLELIGRKLSGEATAEEEKILAKWIREDQSNREIFNQYSRLWDRAGETEQVQQINIDEEWRKFSGSADKRQNTGRLRRMSYIARLAAAVFAGLVIAFSGLLIYKTAADEKVKAVAEVKEVRLPDGSSVTLNTESVLKYPKNFGKTSRELELKGEAFFDVAGNPLKPFIVKAGAIRVKVLGTSFNVEAVAEKNIVEVIVVKGKVGIYGKSGNELKAELVKGEKAVINPETGSVSVNANTNPNFNSYKTRRIVFKNSRLEKVISTLEKTYNTHIRIENPEIKDNRITVTFNNKDLDYVLRTIEATLDLEIEIKGDEVVIR